MKLLYAAVSLLLTTSIYAQKSTLLQNVNYRANELKHSLNKTGDSLILEGERTIYKVEIFNKDYEESLIVKDSKVIIPLNNIPVGRFIVEAVLPDRLIIITLLRNEAISPAIHVPKPRRKTSLFGDSFSEPALANSTPKTEAIERKVAAIDTKLNRSDKKAVGTDETLAGTQKKISLFNKNETGINNTVVAIDNDLISSDKNEVATDETLAVTTQKISLFNKNETGINNTVVTIDNNLISSDKKEVATDEILAMTDETAVLTETNEFMFDKKGKAINTKVAGIDNKLRLTNKKVVRTNETMIVTDKNESLIKNKTAAVDIKSTIIDSEIAVIEFNNTINNRNLEASKNTIENAGRRVVVSYWIVYKTNNRHSSGREMRFGDKKLVNKMISHNNLDRRTKAGKYNELFIWEIYDVSKFLKYKMKNPNGFSSESDCFNSVPFYKMENDSKTL